MSDISTTGFQYFLADHGAAMICGGDPLHRVHSSGVVYPGQVQSPPGAIFEDGSVQHENIAAMTWAADDDNNASSAHKTWSACEMAATYDAGTGGTVTLRSGTITMPDNVFSATCGFSLGSVFGNSSSGFLFYSNIGGGWTATADGVVRLCIIEQIAGSNVPSQYEYIDHSTEESDDSFIRENYTYPITFYKYQDYYAHERRCFPSILSGYAVLRKRGETMYYISGAVTHAGDATVRADWTAVRVKSGDKVMFGPVECNRGLMTRLSLAMRSNDVTLDDAGQIVFPVHTVDSTGDELTASMNARGSLSTRAAMIFLPESF